MGVFVLIVLKHSIFDRTFSMQLVVTLIRRDTLPASDLSLYCLPLSDKKDDRRVWANPHPYIFHAYIYLKRSRPTISVRVKLLFYQYGVMRNSNASQGRKCTAKYVPIQKSTCDCFQCPFMHLVTIRLQGVIV